MRLRIRHGRAVRRAKAWQPSFGKDHFLITSKSGQQRRIYIVRLSKSGDKAIPLIVARLWINKKPECGGWTVAESAAQGGYGPAIYDAGMELVYPDGLTADLGSTSPAAQKVWNYYLAKRKDVAHEAKPDKCKLKGVEALDQVYKKKPGKFRSSVMPVEKFNKHPAVVKHFGGAQSFGDPAMDMWDGTPNVPGGWG
jgi:hypothetical protein